MEQREDRVNSSHDSTTVSIIPPLTCLFVHQSAKSSTAVAWWTRPCKEHPDRSEENAGTREKERLMSLPSSSQWVLRAITFFSERLKF